MPICGGWIRVISIDMSDWSVSVTMNMHESAHYSAIYLNEMQEHTEALLNNLRLRKSMTAKTCQLNEHLQKSSISLH